jgi:hypothetical protein
MFFVKESHRYFVKQLMRDAEPRSTGLKLFVFGVTKHSSHLRIKVKVR